MNKFVFIIPFYNVANYIQECISSLIGQDYRNWTAVLADDCSSDNSTGNINVDGRFSIIRSSERQTALPNIHNAIMSSELEDDDIICILDGDDKLTMPQVCSILDQVYTKFDPLLTYGQYITSQGMVGHCRPYTPQTFSTLRNNMYWASHLRTFKYKLYKQIIIQDPGLTCYKDVGGKFYTMAYDVAMMTPMLEIAGFNNVIFNPIPLYYYRIHQNNDHIINYPLQASIANDIYRKPKFKQMF